MERIENESFWLGKSRLYRRIRKRESLKGPETPAVIIGVAEVGEMIFELSVRIVMIAFDGRFRPRWASKPPQGEVGVWDAFPQPVGMRTLQNARLMTAHLSRRDAALAGDRSPEAGSHVHV